MTRPTSQTQSRRSNHWTTKMDGADLHKARLQALMEKRRLQTEIEDKRRQLEEEKQKLKQIQSKLRREQWLLGNVSPEENGDVVLGPEKRKMAEEIERMEVELRALCDREALAEALERELSIRLQESDVVTLADIRRQLQEHFAETGPTENTPQPAYDRPATFFPRRLNNYKGEQIAVPISVQMNVERCLKTGETRLISASPIAFGSLPADAIKVYEAGGATVLALPDSGTKGGLTPAQLASLVATAREGVTNMKNNESEAESSTAAGNEGTLTESPHLDPHRPQTLSGIVTNGIQWKHEPTSSIHKTAPLPGFVMEKPPGASPNSLTPRDGEADDEVFEMTGTNHQNESDTHSTDESSSSPVTLLFLGYKSVEDPNTTCQTLGIPPALHAERIVVGDSEEPTTEVMPPHTKTTVKSKASTLPAGIPPPKPARTFATSEGLVAVKVGSAEPKIDTQILTPSAVASSDGNLTMATSDVVYPM
uniref:paralemmin-1-like isoform X2 n=1 Tax=Myxine glutinosa TaxID=7769 RepID=UPI0035900F4D